MMGELSAVNLILVVSATFGARTRAAILSSSMRR